MKNPLVGQQLANFHVERLIGRGGMAEVYYGHDTMLHRPVAIKIIDARLRSNATYARRFIQEARTVAQWRHENIVQIHFANEENDLFYFAMEYIEGLDLSVLLASYKEEGTLVPQSDVLMIGEAVGKALDYAHQNGVIHRDIKPSNVMVDQNGRVALTDFGLALDVNQGSIGNVFGSAYYIAPEQARRSSDAVPQSDLYSLAVILYEMLTGVVPFDDPSPASLALQHVTMPPPAPRTLNPYINQATENVLLKALSKEVADRYPDGKSLMAALRTALSEPDFEETTAKSVAKQTDKELSPIQSHITVQEKVKEHFATNPLSSTWDPDAVRSSTRGEANKYSWVTFAAAGASLTILLVFITLALINVSSRGNDTVETNPSSTVTQSVNAAILASQENNSPTPIEPSNTPFPVVEIVTVLATATSLPPSRTPTITSTPILPTATLPEPTATILYPNGRPIELFYDDYSFYILNLDDRFLEISSISFEGLNEIGQSAGYRFSGLNWASFYEILESGRCNRIETTLAPIYLRPGQCPGYNATITPIISDEQVFWSSLNNISSFRVLWNEQEIGRCLVNDRICDIFLPST